MNKERLLRLADLLDRDAVNDKGISFDMNRWGDIYNPLKPLSCDTAACAMGLAALSREFLAEGLDFIVKGKIITFKWNGEIQDPIFTASLLFDLTQEEVHKLFLEDCELRGAEGEKLKANQIRMFAETGKIVEITL